MTNPNDPAHPQHGWSKDPETLERMKSQAGLTKREHFAAMAMQGILANLGTFEKGKYQRDGVQVTPSVTILAVDVADMLIAELNKEPSK